MADVADLLALLERDGPVSASRLMAGLAVSQPTLSRLLVKAGARVQRIGRARASRYAARRSLMGSDKSISLYAIDGKGRPAHIASLAGLARDHFYVESADEFWLRGESGAGLYESLPYFLYDVRPQGFMGRQIARRYAISHGFPEDPRDWSDEQTGVYFINEGYDLPGHIVVGEQSMSMLQMRTAQPVANRAQSYPALASRVLSEGLPGSSAGGEQQKFTCLTAENGHVIVKFSPAGDTAEAVRWRDLLICEHHALACLSDAGVPASSTRMFDFAGRIFLEVTRFDRSGERGRVPMLSLSAIDAEFVGLGQSWSQVAARLQQHKLVSNDDARTCLLFELYSQWIGNSDRHLGNISMTLTDHGFALLPAYDILPMIYAPERGEIMSRNISYPVRPMHNDDLWLQAGVVAKDFWGRVVEDVRISQDFRALVASNLRDTIEILYE